MKGEGLGSVPHAGEVAGPGSIRGALDMLQADRIRHGIRAVEDQALLRELADRSVVCDVARCPTSVPGSSGRRRDHPLPAMIEAGVLCSVSTDDPAMFGTDLTMDYEVAAQLEMPQLLVRLPGRPLRGRSATLRPGSWLEGIHASPCLGW